MTSSWAFWYFFPMIFWYVSWYINCLDARIHPLRHRTIRRWHHILAVFFGLVPFVNIGIAFFMIAQLIEIYVYSDFAARVWEKMKPTRSKAKTFGEWLDEPCGCGKKP